MAFSPIDPTDPVGLVRILSRDNDPDPSNQVNDEDTLLALFAIWGNDVYLVASKAVMLMAGDAAKEAQVQKFGSFTIGPGKTMFNALREYADSLLEQSTNNAIPVVTHTPIMEVSSVGIHDNTLVFPYNLPTYPNILRRDADLW